MFILTDTNSKINIKTWHKIDASCVHLSFSCVLYKEISISIRNIETVARNYEWHKIDFNFFFLRNFRKNFSTEPDFVNLISNSVCEAKGRWSTLCVKERSHDSMDLACQNIVTVCRKHKTGFMNTQLISRHSNALPFMVTRFKSHLWDLLQN